MICKLCKTDTKLCNSHIIPEFLYNILYDDKHRAFVVPLNKSRKIQVIQRGIRESLLCLDCEEQISRYEGMARSLLVGNILPIRKISHFNEHFELSNINYDSFKLFLLSILWRASITDSELFKFISLGDEHEDTIRTMILTEDPGASYQYGCLMSSVELHGKLLDIIRMPDVMRMEGHKTYRFLIGGFLWAFVVSNHSKAFSLKKLFLQEDGKQIVLRFRVNELPFLIKELEQYKEKKKDMAYLLNKS